MQTTLQSNTRFPVYLHPSACNSPATVTNIQYHTWLLAILTLKGRIEAVQPVATDVGDASTWQLGGDAV